MIELYDDDALVVSDRHEGFRDLVFHEVLDADIAGVRDFSEVLHEEVELESLLKILERLAGHVLDVVEELAHVPDELDVRVGQSAVVVQLDVVAFGHEGSVLGLEVSYQSGDPGLLGTQDKHLSYHFSVRSGLVHVGHLAQHLEKVVWTW